MGSNRANAICAAIKNTELVSARLTVAATCLRFCRSQPARRRPHEQSDQRHACGQPQSRERRARSDQTSATSTACSPPTSRCASSVPMSATNGRWRDSHRPQPSAIAESTPAIANTACAPVSQPGDRRRFSLRPCAFFHRSQHACDQDQQRRPGGKGVVLLVGRDAEEQQRERREQPQQPDGAHTELEASHVGGYIFACRVVEIEVDSLAGVAAQMLHP